MDSVSAEYEYENKSEDRGHRNKFDFNPVKYDYPEEKGPGQKAKGYTFTHHDVFEETQDESFANHTFLGLSENIDFSKVVVEKEMDVLDLVLFTPLLAPNGRYLKNVNGQLFAITTPQEQLTDKNMFKFYRSYRSSDDTAGFVVSQATKFATVKLFMNRFNVEMQEMIMGDALGRQHFDVYQIPGTNRISICSRLRNPWGIIKTQGLDEDQYDWSEEYEGEIPGIKEGVGRFWSIYDANSSDLAIRNWMKGYPRYIYESKVPFPNMVKINGNIHNQKHRGQPDATTTDASKRTMNRIGNNYLFKAGYLEDNDRFFMIGYDGKIRWVKYYNEFFDKFFNTDVTPDKIIEDVKPSIIYECPYKTLMDKDGMKMNFSELKNVMTPGYSYTTRDK